MADVATLFLAIDAIPHRLAHDAWKAGDLPGFREPLPMVSVFPSLTNVAVPALLRGVLDTRSPGYEVRYYDADADEIRGGFSDADAEIGLEPFHGHLHGLFGHGVVYFLRRSLAYGQARWITHRFIEHAGPWLGYVSATDGVAHFGGRESLERSFADVCRAVVEALEEHRSRTGQRAEAVLCSDHGMAFGRFAHLSASELEQRLKDAGFRADGASERRAVLVPLGDVGAGVVYTADESARAVAEIVAAAPGVELVFAKTQDGCWCLRRQEGEAATWRAQIRWRGDRYRYDTEHGDPLGYDPTWRELECAGRLDDGWARDRDLFEASWSHPYPDALARVRGGLEDMVQFPAQVLFSMKESHTYGPSLTHLGARLMGGQVATHGALGAAQSLGFASCTHADARIWPGARALRPSQVFSPWAGLVRAGAVGAP